MMLSGIYNIADVVVQITSLYDEVQNLCADYRSDEKPLLHISTSQEDIEAEGVKSDQEREREGLPEFHFEASYLETLAVYRKLATQLIPSGVLLIHGSVIAVDGEAYLFTALSGTGKSTHVRLWRELFGERAVMINDDKPLIRVGSETSIVYGTPWDGKHHLSTNTSVPLRAIIHLQRGTTNHIEPQTPAQMLPTLLQQTFLPKNGAVGMQVLSLLDTLSRQVKFYNLHCNMEPEAARIAYEGMH